MTGLDHWLRGPEGAPVLVLSNSLGTTQELWERQLPAFVERFRVLTYDHPGVMGSVSSEGAHALPSGTSSVSSGSRCAVSRWAAWSA